MKTLRIGLLGYGTVGQGVAKILEKKGDRLRQFLGVDLVIEKILVRDKTKEREVKVDKSLFTEDYFEVVDNPKIDLIIEVLSSIDEAKEMMARSMYNGKHVVSANKAAISKYFEELTALAKDKNVNFLYESSVGGGITVIKPLYDLVRINEMERVRGILNGTSNYILSKMTSDNLSYAEALKGAQELGYAEEDPSADVGGLDTLRKLRILSTIAFKEKIEEDEFLLDGITKLSDLDIKLLGEKNKVIKLIGETIACVDTIWGVVQPVAVEKGSYFASVNDAYNTVTLKGDEVGELKYFGSGAGMLPTANAVLSDVIDIVLGNQKPTLHGAGYKRIVESNEATGIFYVRTNAKSEALDEVVDEVLSERPKAFITKEMKLVDLRDLVRADREAAIVRIEDEEY